MEGVEMTILRWIAVPIVAVLALYVIFILGMFATMWIPCPPDLVVSGACTAPWHQNTVNSLVVAFAGIAAFFVVRGAAWMAPSHRVAVAWAAYLVGFAFAVFALIDAKNATSYLYATFFAAIASGLLALWLVIRAHRRATLSPM